MMILRAARPPSLAATLLGATLLVFLSMSTENALAQESTQQEDANAAIDEDLSGVTATVSIGYQPQPSASGTSGSAPGGSAAKIPKPFSVILADSCGLNVGGGNAHTFVEGSINGCLTKPPLSVAEVRDVEAPSPGQLAGVAIDRAMALARPPQLRMAPSAVGLTGLTSYFWLDRRPPDVSATAELPGLSVTAEASPVTYVWDFGDGFDHVSSHHGRPWTEGRPGNIGHLYETRGRYEVTAEVIYEARWRIGAGPWQPLGYFSNSASDPYPVRQMRAVLVPSDR